MEREHAASSTQGLGIINLVLGIWLIVSPYLFGYGLTQEKINFTILGIIVALLAILKLAIPTQRWASWVNGFAGIWLIIAPFILGFTSMGAIWNEVIVGILLAIFAFWDASIAVTPYHRHHHHVVS